MAEDEKRGIRDEKGRFIKGNIANPSGRPKVPIEVREALKLASPQALQVLINIMNNEEAAHKDRINTACYILDKTYGKNFQVYKDEQDGVTTVRIIDDL